MTFGPSWTLAITPADVERARLTGQPVTVSAAEAAFAESIPKLPKRDFTPPDVYVSGGEVQLDHNPRLSMYDWFGAYGEIGQLDQMRREWSIVQAGCLAWTLTTLSRSWTVDPARGGDKNDLMIAEFVRDVIEGHFAGGNGGMLGLLTPFAELPWRGFVLGQPYYPVDRSVVVRDEDGREVLRGVHTLQIAPISQWTVKDWIEEAGRDGRREWGCRVYNVGSDASSGSAGGVSGSDVTFTAGQLIHARFLPATDNPSPMGLLRPLWSLWQIYRTLNKLQVNGWQKAAFGVPEVVVGPEANPADLATVNSIVGNLRSGGLARFSLPPGYSVQWHEVPFRAGGIDATKQELKFAALAGLFTQHIGTGSGNGTQALHGSQKAEFHQLAEIVARSIVQALCMGPADRSPIKRLVSLNFRDVDRYPMLAYGQRPIADPVAFATGLVTAADGGILTTDGGIEERVRQAFGIGEMPMETRDSWRHRLENSAPPEIGGGGDDGGDEPPPPAPVDATGSVTDEGGEAADEVEEESDVESVSLADREVLAELFADHAGEPAPPADRIRGSRRNPEGSASGKRGGIEVSPSVEKALRNKVDEHNERRTSKSRRVDIGMLKAVYRRGAGAYSVSHRPGMTRNQWSMGRVNGFLKRVAGTGGHPQDDDLLPEGHPNKPKEMSEHMSRRVAGCIATKLTEGMDYDQALATCLSMEEAGRLGPRGGYRAVQAKDRVEGDKVIMGPKGRSVRPIEEVIRFSETKGTTNGGKSELAQVLESWRLGVAEEYGKAVAEGAKNLGDVAGIPVPRQSELIASLRPVLRRVYKAGQIAVENEIERLEDEPELAEALQVGDVEVSDVQTLAEDDTHTPPEPVREAARKALEVRAEKPPSQRGMTAVGIARARDLANGRPVSIRTMRRMASWFARHEVDKEGSTWEDKGKGWQAWHGWGGDPGRAWVRDILEREDAQAMSEHELGCPAATQDLEVNTRNRDAAIKADFIKYGPLNVDEPGSFWVDIAEYWDTTVEAAQKSKCSNCVAFDVSPRMKACMPGDTSDDDGVLGYCHMHHFKCHSARSCRTWAKGGPIVTDEVSIQWQSRSSGALNEGGCACCPPPSEGFRLPRTLAERIADPICLAVTPKSAGRRRVKAPEPSTDVPSEPQIDDIDPEEAITSVARTTAAAMFDRLKTMAANLLQAAGIGGSLPENVADVVADGARELSPGVEENAAQGDVNTIFGLGRMQQLRAEGSEVYTFSNLLESQTCEFCEQYDGTTFGPDELPFFATPFRLCLGGDKCNCLIIAASLPPQGT